jgi:hypothetical protein
MTDVKRPRWDRTNHGHSSILAFLTRMVEAGDGHMSRLAMTYYVDRAGLPPELHDLYDKATLEKYEGDTMLHALLLGGLQELKE